MNLHSPLPYRERGIPPSLDSNPSLPVACIVTGEGIAGIATIQISGAAAVDVVARIFRGRREIEPSGNIYYGRIVNPATEEVIDDVVVGCYPPQESPTGEILSEIHCHGGKATIAAISRLLKSMGVKFQSHEEWMSRLPGGAIEKAALCHFLRARTDVAARVFLYQLQGCLRSALQQIERAICDNPELALALTSQLGETASTGLALSVPSQIVIAGTTNVGKSTLLNRIVGRERVIVDPQPGTTRDAVGEYTAIRGIPFVVIDTAGLRESTDPLEQLGMASARRAIAAADVLIWMYDVGRPLAEMPPPPEKKMVVLNKIDACPNYLEEYLQRFPQGIAISALTGEGIDSLQAALVAGIYPPHGPAPIIFEKSHAAILEGVAESLKAGQLSQAKARLAELLE